MSSRQKPFHKRKKLTAKDCREIYNEYLDIGTKAGKNFVLKKISNYNFLQMLEE